MRALGVGRRAGRDRNQLALGRADLFGICRSLSVKILLVVVVGCNIVLGDKYFRSSLLSPSPSPLSLSPLSLPLFLIDFSSYVAPLLGSVA